MSNTAKINTVISADSSQFTKSINDAQKQVEAFSKHGLSEIGKEIAGAFAVEKVMEWGKAQLENAEAMVKLSESIGVSTDSLQALYSVGRTQHLDTESIDKGLSKLSVAQDKVVNGNKEMTEAFSRFGISAQNVAGMDIQELFEAIAKGAENDATAIGDVTEIFGRGMGVKMMPMLKQIADEGFQGITDKAKEAGEVIDSVNLKQMASMAEELEHGFKRATTVMVNGLMTVVNILKDMYTLYMLLNSGVGFGDAMKMLSEGTVGSKKEAQDIKNQEAIDKAHEQTAKAQKIKQEADNEKLKLEEKYQKDLAKMLKSFDKLQEGEEKKALARQIAKIKKEREEEARKFEIRKGAWLKKNDLEDDFDKESSNIREGLKPVVANNLQSQGAGLGQGISANYAIQEQQLKIQEKIAELNRKHNEALNKIDVNTERQCNKMDEMKTLLSDG